MTYWRSRLENLHLCISCKGILNWNLIRLGRLQYNAVLFCKLVKSWRFVTSRICHIWIKTDNSFPYMVFCDVTDRLLFVCGYWSSQRADCFFYNPFKRVDEVLCFIIVSLTYWLDIFIWKFKLYSNTYSISFWYKSEILKTCIVIYVKY